MKEIEEFKNISYKKDNDIPFPDVIYDKPSFYVAYILAKFNFSANQISAWGLVIGLFSSIFFLFDNIWSIVTGCILLFSSHIFDASDGKVARYREKKGLKDEPFRNYGGFFDWLNNLVAPTIVLTISIGFVARTGKNMFLIAGIITAIVVFVNYGLVHFIESLLEKEITEYNKFSILRGYINNVCTLPFFLLFVGILTVIFDGVWMGWFLVFYFLTNSLLLISETNLVFR